MAGKKLAGKQLGRHGRVIYLHTGAFILLLAVTWMVFVSRYTALDESVFRFVSPYVTPDRTIWMKAITFLGNHKFLVPANLLLIGILLLANERFTAWQVFVVALSSLALKLGLKEVFARNRPADPMVDGITNYSFPSGHALMSVAFFGMLIWLADKYILSAFWRRACIIVLVFLILLISFSRVYLRVHYTTDVMAGLCLGSSWVYFCLWFTQKMRNRRSTSGLVDEPVNRPF